jgi:hypothetical protein
MTDDKSGQISRRTALGAMTALGSLSVPRAIAAGTYTLAPVEYGMQLKTPDGRVVFEYMTKKPENIGLTSPSVACFHPVNTPTGERVTSIAPNDHPHHRGIFFGWHDAMFYSPGRPPADSVSSIRSASVTRADFWGWGVYAPREGRIVQNREVKLVSADASHAEIEIRNDLMVDNRKFGEENDRARVTERDGVFVLDLAYTIVPSVEFRVAQNAFGGFDVQCRKDGDSYYSNASGKVTLRNAQYAYPELDWPSEPWYDFTITVAGSGKTVGAAVLDHPGNPPTLWHGSRTLWMLNPCIVALGPKVITPETPMTLRYRVVIHDGPPPTDTLQKLSAEWRGMSE